MCGGKLLVYIRIPSFREAHNRDSEKVYVYATVCMHACVPPGRPSLRLGGLHNGYVACMFHVCQGAPLAWQGIRYIPCKGSSLNCTHEPESLVDNLFWRIGEQSTNISNCQIVYIYYLYCIRIAQLPRSVHAWVTIPTKGNITVIEKRDGKCVMSITKKP